MKKTNIVAFLKKKKNYELEVNELSQRAASVLFVDWSLISHLKSISIFKLASPFHQTLEKRTLVIAGQGRQPLNENRFSPPPLIASIFIPVSSANESKFLLFNMTHKYTPTDAIFFDASLNGEKKNMIFA